MLLHRFPSLHQLRVEFPLMYPKLYIGPFCRELAGIVTGVPSSHHRADPDGFFADCRHHTTDTRLDPKVRDPAGTLIPFGNIRKGDLVKARLVLETWVSPHSRLKKRKVDVHLRAQGIKVVERGGKTESFQENIEENHWEGSDDHVVVTPVSDILI